MKPTAEVATKQKKKRKKRPLPPRVLGPVTWPVCRRLEGMRLQRGGNDREVPFARSKRVATEKMHTLAVLGLCPEAPPFPLVVTITRIAPGVLDTDNLAGSAKSVRDAIAHWLGVDDGKAERAGQVTWVVHQTKSGAGAYHVDIDIRAVNAPRASAVELLAAWQARGCPRVAQAPLPGEIF